MASLSLEAEPNVAPARPSNDTMRPPRGTPAPIRVMAFDVDGVFTDGCVYLTPDGTESKRIGYRDLDAVGAAHREGLRIALVTGERGAIVDTLSARIHPDLVLDGAKDKAAGFAELCDRLGVEPSEVCYVGDADRDVPALRLAGLGLCPTDASPRAKAAADQVLGARGGDGAVSEAVSVVTALGRSARPSPSERAVLERIASDSLAAHRRFLGEALPVLHEVALAIARALRAGGKVLLCGNGGSAADAQHVAAELMGRFLIDRNPWPAIALTTDTSILTAVGNDWEFADVFARQVRGLARAGDVVVGISTSGASENVLRALDAARNLGAVRIGFTGASGSKLSARSDLCFLAPANSTPRIQELHLLAWHSVCELVELVMTEDRTVDR